MNKVIVIMISSIFTTTVFAANCESMSIELIKEGLLCQTQTAKEAKALKAVKENNTPVTQQAWHDAAQNTFDCQFKAIDVCRKY